MLITDLSSPRMMAGIPTLNAGLYRSIRFLVGDPVVVRPGLGLQRHAVRQHPAGADPGVVILWDGVGDPQWAARASARAPDRGRPQLDYAVHGT
jgi:hypothetical protein